LYFIHVQMFCAFSLHLFLGFRVYTPTQSIVNHSLFFLLCMIPCFSLCICFSHFSTLTISMWFCLYFFIRVITWIVVSLCLWIYMIQIMYLLLCRNPSLGLTTKARGCKVAGQKRKLENEKKCEGMNPHTTKGAPTLGIGVPMDSRMFRERL
jgi:hypothetical protein